MTTDPLFDPDHWGTAGMVRAAVTILVLLVLVLLVLVLYGRLAPPLARAVLAWVPALACYGWFRRAARALGVLP